ncbi:MAG: acetate--CoA ligase family protein [Bacteroidota bacterium]
MINKELIYPSSIVVIGASNDIQKPGGKLFKNLVDGDFKGELYAVNPKEEVVQERPCYRDIKSLPNVDLAFLAIPAKFCIPTVELLAGTKKTRAFVIISAGFSEEGDEGKKLEEQLLNIVNEYGASLIGPNCIGLLTQQYNGVFTTPVPRLEPNGCDLISGSGATAVFIMESGIPKGLSFHSVFSVGNSAQNGVEEVLQYMDEQFDPEHSSKIKLLYIESIKNPDKLLKHATSLIRKGCAIAAIKAGGSEAGSRAASSHTGALASADSAVEALFRKAGIIRCFGREELTTVASVLMHKELKGKNIAIITHAGGPAVMLTDALSQGGMEVPPIKGEKSKELLSNLFPGASVNNPIDLLATGTPKQLGMVIDYCDSYFDNIDAMMVIFGSSGLSRVFSAYEVLHEKIQTCRKPIFPVLPSIITAREEVELFISKGHSNFPDEVQLGNALTKVYNTPKPAEEKIDLEGVNITRARQIIDAAPDGYQPPETVTALLESASINVVPEGVARSRKKLLELARLYKYPLALKVVGPVHKSDVGGVVLNIKNEKHLIAEYLRLKKIKESTGVLVQPMLNGMELFVGAKYEKSFGHVILCGLGGIFVEVLRDVSSGLAPLTYSEAHSMIRSLRSYKMIKGTRGKPGINEEAFASVVVKLSSLLRFATDIQEIDLNPIIATPENLSVVDARILIKK